MIPIVYTSRIDRPHPAIDLLRSARELVLDEGGGDGNGGWSR